MFFDFRTITNLPAWQIVNYEVMGGVPTSRSEMLTSRVAAFGGVMTLDNKGGFASVWSSMRQNLVGLDTFVVRVRVDGRRYKCPVRIGTGFDTPIYQCAFTTKRGECGEHRRPFRGSIPTCRRRVFTKVPPSDAARTTSVGFLDSDKQDGSCQLKAGWIKTTFGARK